VDELEVRAALDEHFRDSLIPVTGGLAGLYLLFVVADYVTMPAPVGLVTAAINLCLALAFLLVHLTLRVWGIRPSLAHPFGTVLALVVLANSLVPLYWLGEPVQTTYLILIELGAALFFLHWGALSLVVGVADVAWYVAFLRAGYSFEWATFGLSLAAATMLAGLAHGVRMRMHERYARLHFAEERREKDLELAVEVATQSERRFRSLVEATSEGILVVDGGRIIDHNPAFVGIFGWPAEEVAGRTLSEFLPPESLARLEQVKYSGTRAPLEVVGLRRDGAHIPLQIAVKLAPFQGRFVSLLAIRDLPMSAGAFVGTPRPLFRARRR
jgi:PAS domain S-box-containing protein